MLIGDRRKDLSVTKASARLLLSQSAVSRALLRRTYSSILQDNCEDVKVVQELLRHSSTKMTLDVYAQELTPSKRAAQRKVVTMIGENLRVPHSVLRKIGTLA